MSYSSFLPQRLLRHNMLCVSCVCGCLSSEPPSCNGGIPCHLNLSKKQGQCPTLEVEGPDTYFPSACCSWGVGVGSELGQLDMSTCFFLFVCFF